MKKKNKETFFWASYSDLMTSLFFIMLVLFAVTVVLMYRNSSTLRDQNSQVSALRAQISTLQNEVLISKKREDELKKVEESTRDLDSKYFLFRPDYKKYVLRINVYYMVGSSDIYNLNDTVREKLVKAGKAIENFLHEHDNTKYLLLVEGQASRDGASKTTNYNLSYRRALGLVEYWESKGIDFGGNCELQISGSGDGTLQTNTISMRENFEQDNQRFLIHLLPKNIIQDEYD